MDQRGEAAELHLPTREPQLPRDYIGVAVPDLDDLTAHPEATKSSLVGTACSFAKEDGRVIITCPRGNRFQDILDPETGETLFLIEHEFRSVRHLMYQRGLVNRDPAQELRAYALGRGSLTV